MELQDIPIPFLPLEKSFNHRDVQSWSRLAEVISSWLVNDIKALKSQEWTWGTNIFWMAFVAAYCNGYGTLEESQGFILILHAECTEPVFIGRARRDTS